MTAPTTRATPKKPLISGRHPDMTMPVDPLYVDVIVRSYEAATGNRAVLAETSEAFEAVAARRASETATV